MRKTLWFFAVSATLMSLFVWLNVAQWDARKARAFIKADLGKRVDYLFQNGHIHPQVSLALYHKGISTRPRHALVGRDGWLFLGDAFNQSVSKAHGSFTEPPGTVTRWNRLARERVERLAALGIPMVFLLAPNKHSIYPERAPDWIDFQEESFTDRLFDAAAAWDAPVVDPRAELRKARIHSEPLYGVTDTHWTHRGAYIAFQELEKALQARFPAFTPIPQGQLSFTLERLPACCLARLIGIAGELPKDHDAMHRMHTPTNGSYLCSAAAGPRDREKCEAINHGPPLMLGEDTFPVSRNPEALNPLNVLLVLDSFGEALSPIFALSFATVTKVAVGQLVAQPSLLDEIVAKTQPDLVVFQVVERNLLLPYWEGEEKATRQEARKTLPI